MNDKRLVLRVFLPLYASQFLGIGFLFTALMAISRDRGQDLEDIGVIFLLGMVWTLKFIWAPLVDRFGSRKRGHYRSWIMITQPAVALGIAAIAPFDVIDNLGVIIICLAFVAIMSATQDVATDALAVRSLGGTSRGNINGLQIGAGFIGDIVGGALVLVLYDLFGWVPAILTLAALTAVPIFFIRKYREEDRGEAPERVKRASAIALFKQPGVKRWALVITPLLSIGMPGAYGLLVPMLVDGNVSVGMVGVLTNGIGGVIGIGAALVAGALVNRLGRKRALVLYGLSQVIGIAAALPLAAGGGLGAAILAVVLINIANSAVFVIMYTINMDHARPENAGSDFTVQVSISFGMRFLVGGLIFGVADSAGYTPAMLICLGAAVVGVAAAALLFRDKSATATVTELPTALPTEQAA
jgi:MFS family permease